METSGDAAASPLIKKIVIIVTFVIFTGVSIAIIITAAVGLEFREPEETVNRGTAFQWSYECVDNKCSRKLPPDNGTDDARLQSLAVCQLTCHDWGNLWPQPNGEFSMSKELKSVDVDSFELTIANGKARQIILNTIRNLEMYIQSLGARKKYSQPARKVNINVNLNDAEYLDLTLQTDESYKLQFIDDANTGVIRIDVESKNFFGTRHALETIKQLIVFDDIHSEFMAPTNVSISDGPFYSYRGISLDTARNFFSVDSIKKTLDAMAACKLNRFHWHITDTHSFSFMSKSYPELTQYGALKASKVYHPEDIKSIVEYGLQKGIRVIPEFDAPSHVGAGWEMTNLTVCYMAEPWDFYCYEPPCGQFDPTKNELYNILEGVYRDMMDYFQPDIFHMGGDEVKFECWNETDSIVSWMSAKSWQADDRGFFDLWKYFQSEAQARLFKVNGNKKIPIILWSSRLTDNELVDSTLNKDDYIIQFWESNMTLLNEYLSSGFKTIVSNYDALYLDCGFSSWVGEGLNNWCSPYIGWQKIYNNSLQNISENDANKKNILGAEAALWSEQADTTVLDGRLWPRAASMAEVLWAEPGLRNYTWREAESRMLSFRERLVQMGINAESLKPEWCHRNDGHCQ